MKKHILFFICLMALVFASCSKSKEEAAATKTVDLGESTAEDGKDKNKTSSAKAKFRENAAKNAKNNKNDVNKDDIRKNEEARVDEKGRPKRGEPAAQTEAEEKQAKKKGTETAKAEDQKEAEGMDFTDDADVADAVPEKQILPARTPRPKDALNIEKLINIRELREQTGYAGALSEAWLLGQNPDARYNAMRLATDNEKQLGFSVQVWKPGNESAAIKRFNDLYQQSFGGKKIKTVANDAFVASHHDINELGFFEKSKRAAVLLSCSSDVCKPEQLQAVALIIQRRL